MALKKVLAACGKSGFLYKGGGDNIHYGFLGAQLKRNVVNEWWHAIITSTDYIYPVVSPVEQTDEQNKGIFAISHGESGNLQRHLNQETNYDFYRKMVRSQPPFGVAEIDKVYHHSVDEESIFNSHEREVAAMQFFCPLADYKSWCSQWQKTRMHWWKKFSVNPEKFSLGKGEDGDPHQLSTVQFQFDQNTYSLETLSGKECSPSEGKSDSSSISLSTIIDRAVFAFICDAYTEASRPYGESTLGKNTVFQFHASLAPYQVAVISKDSTNEMLNMYCRKLAEELRLAGIATTGWSDGSYEGELVLQDEMGTPFRVIGSGRTLETGTVMLQSGDTTLEEEINGRDVLTVVRSMLLGARLD